MLIELKNPWTVNSKRVKDLKGVAPCTALSLLVDNKIIGDPYFRDNENIAREYLEDDYTFETTFSLTDEQLKNDNYLCLDRICTVADIFVNNAKIASVLNFHLSYTIHLDKDLLKKENTLKMVFKSSYKYISEYPNPSGAFDSFISEVNLTAKGSATLRQPHSMFGWDWGPSLGDIGITKPVYILSNKVGYLDYYRREFRFDGNKVFVDITPHAVLKDDSNIEIELSGFGYKESKNTKNSKTVTFEINNPKLWYPAGLGEQPLYNLTIKLCGKEDTYESKHHLGIREIKIDDSFDAIGRNLALYVNGKKVFLKGANFIPEDSMLTKVTKERTQRLLDLTVQFNHNVIRVWGGGYYPDNDFYDYCDQIGLLVMQDLMFACSSYDIQDQAFKKTVIEEIQQNVRRMSQYASVFLISGNNEIEDGVRGRPFIKVQRSEEMFNEVLADVVSKETSLYYMPSSPTSGKPYFASPNDPNYLDTHYWWVWAGDRPFEDYLSVKPRLLSEFGCQSFTTYSTIERFTIEEDREPNSPVMKSHSKLSPPCNDKIIRYTENLFKGVNNLKDLAYLSMLDQAEGMKLCVEHLRQNKDICNGAIYWQLNDCWPGQSWSSIDYYFGLKALLYYAKKFYAPDLVSFNYEKTGVVTVSNDTDEDKNYQIIIQEFDINGRILGIQEKQIKVNKFEHENVDIKKSENVFGLVAQLYNDDHQLLSENYLIDKKDKEIDYPKATITVSQISENEFEITADTFVRGLYLVANNDVVFSDNYFNLLPSISKKIITNTNIDINDLEIMCVNNLY